MGRKKICKVIKGQMRCKEAKVETSKRMIVREKREILVPRARELEGGETYLRKNLIGRVESLT